MLLIIDNVYFIRLMFNLLDLCLIYCLIEDYDRYVFFIESCKYCLIII